MQQHTDAATSVVRVSTARPPERTIGYQLATRCTAPCDTLLYAWKTHRRSQEGQQVGQQPPNDTRHGQFWFVMANNFGNSCWCVMLVCPDNGVVHCHYFWSICVM
jgi:hypothetical protein